MATTVFQTEALIKTAAAKAATSKAASKAPVKKAAAKNAKPAEKATAKPAAKPAAKVAAKTAAKPAQAIKYAIEDFARPQAGAALAAHTAAFLALSGMNDGKACPRALATKVIGPRAISYHIGNKNFEVTEEGIALTAKGINAMNARTIDAEKFAAFSEFFKNGALNESINVKTEGARIKV